MSSKESGERCKIIGNTHHAAQRYRQAVEAYGHAIQHDPDRAVYYNNRAASLIMLRELRKAEEDCTSALRLCPGYIKAAQRLGNVRVQRGKLSAAKDSFAAVVKIVKSQNDDNSATHGPSVVDDPASVIATAKATSLRLSAVASSLELASRLSFDRNDPLAAIATIRKVLDGTADGAGDRHRTAAAGSVSN